MDTYRVRWEIDVDADSAEDAVGEARRMMAAPSVFETWRHVAGVVVDGAPVVVDEADDGDASVRRSAMRHIRALDRMIADGIAEGRVGPL